MAATDLVPCFYTGQDFRWEKPAELRPRAECHSIKKLKLGRFDQDGKIFLFFKSIVTSAKRAWDGPLGIGNLIPFARLKNEGDKLHYETPMAGDKTAFARSRRREISVSHRALFSRPGMQWANYVHVPLIRRDFRKHPNFSVPQVLKVNDDGLYCVSDIAEGSAKWSAFTKFQETRNLFMLQMGARMFRVIPKRALSTPEIDELRELLRRRLSGE